VRRTGYSRALARKVLRGRTRRAGLSASFVSPSEHPAPNRVLGPSVVFAVASTRPAGFTTQASPRMDRLAAPRRRNGFVILQAVRSPPAASHPVSRRSSSLRLHVSRLHIGWTFHLPDKTTSRTHPPRHSRGSPAYASGHTVHGGSRFRLEKRCRRRQSWPDRAHYLENLG
jgi:hypothetical protein